MLNEKQKNDIAEKIQIILKKTNVFDLSYGEIRFRLRVYHNLQEGWQDIDNNAETEKEK